MKHNVFYRKTKSTNFFLERDCPQKVIDKVKIGSNITQALQEKQKRAKTERIILFYVNKVLVLRSFKYPYKIIKKVKTKSIKK